MTDCGNCLSELWTVLYLAAERAQEILAAQAEWRAWLLRGPAAEGNGGHRATAAARGLPSCPRSAWRIDRARDGALFITV
jgi:hypothetical protein